MRYWLAVAAAFLLATLISWTDLARSIDDAAYDWMCRLYPVTRTNPEAVVLAIDETTLQANGGMPALRTILTGVLRKLADSGARSVAVDFNLADPVDPAKDAQLAEAMRRVPRLVLATDIARDGSGWQDPLPEFAKGRALGHTHANPDPVCREIPLEKAAGRERRWAMALEAWRGNDPVLETPAEIIVRDFPFLAARATGRAYRVAFSETIPTVSAANFDPRLLKGKAVFIGTTALTAARDRLMTPLGMMTGVEIHAQLYETMREKWNRTDVAPSIVLLACLGIAALAGTIFTTLNGWIAYATAAMLLLAAHALPHIAFRTEHVFPAVAPMLTAWLCIATAATMQYFQTRRKLATAEAGRSRYQRAIHWVTHEMRTPLTAIQGSSELMARYNLPEDKRKEMSGMINAESKRLAQMISNFLSVERLSAGEIELKKSRLSAATILDTVTRRVQPLVDRKRQTLDIGEAPFAGFDGDRELIEFALYNLITNASKYSGEETLIRVESAIDDGSLRLAVYDQGIGIEEKDLARLGTRFFRTQRAEESGIQGTGIGLSIVREIVAAHGGRIEIASRLGEGSCFTIVIPASVPSEVKSET